MSCWYPISISFVERFHAEGGISHDKLQCAGSAMYVHFSIFHPQEQLR